MTIAVVATFGIDAVAVSCVCIVVACCFIEASFNFKFVAYSVGIGIGDAVSFAIITCIREDTAYQVGDEVWIDVVARFCADASFDFKRVTDTISVRMYEAFTVAVVSILREFAHFGSTWRDTCFFNVEQCSDFIGGRSVDECLHIQGS